MNIAFIIAKPVISGGNYVIVQHADYLRKAGHHVTLVCFESPGYDSPWHPALDHLTIQAIDRLPDEQFDLTYATQWESVFHIHQVRSRQYAYFVQSIESHFYPRHQKNIRTLINSTYHQHMPVVTEATWIKIWLEKIGGFPVYLARNGARKDIYNTEVTPIAPKTAKLRLLVEGSMGVPLKNTARTVRLLQAFRPEVEVWLLSASDIYALPGTDRTYSKISIKDTSRVYRSCDILIKLSYVEGMFGPPLEMFHCGGTAVVYDVPGHDEYIQHEHNALVCPMANESEFQNSLKRLINDPDLLARLKSNALQSAEAWQDWPQASQVFAEATTKIIEHAPAKQDIQSIKQNLDQARQAYEASSGQSFGHQARPSWKETLKSIRPLARFIRTNRAYYKEAHQYYPADYFIEPSH